MSTGQWEVVGKNKKSQNGKVKNPKEDEKKPAKNVSKVEEIIPYSQSLYSGIEVDEGLKPAKKNKKPNHEKTTKPKPPKTLEGSIQAVDTEELASLIASNKIRYTNAPLVWLKEVANFLNSKIQIEADDPVFGNQPANFPMCALPPAAKTLLEDLLKEAGQANSQLFYDITLTTLANDLSRGQVVNGHRILLQMLAFSNPDFCIASIPKSVSLRNSYQNRPPIGLSLLWAFGQGGLVDFNVGLKAWQELFLPLVDLKNYSKYVIAYFSKILDRHARSKATKISQDQLLAMFDLINNKKNGLSKDLASDLMMQLSKYKNIYFSKSGNKLQVTFNQLMKKMSNQYLSGTSLDVYNKVLVESLLDCLERDDSCNATWRQLFHKCSKQSATLLDYIDSNWSNVSVKLKLKSLKTSVLQYKEVCGDALKGKKKDETVVKANKICQDILDRMTSTRRFPWLWASFFLLFGFAGLITYDVSRVNGEFPKSVTGKLFKDFGILEQSQHAWQKTLSSSARGYIWVENNVPIYLTQAIETAKPYGQLSKDIFIVALNKGVVLYGNIRNYIEEKTPAVVATIEAYIPGLVDNVQKYTSAGYLTVKQYSNNYYQFTSEYLKTKVFVGEWAPEILQNKTLTAVNITRTHVTTYFHWFREQVHLYSEIP